MLRLIVQISTFNHMLLFFFCISKGLTNGSFGETPKEKKNIFGLYIFYASDPSERALNDLLGKILCQ